MDTPLEEFAAQMRENPTPQEETLARYLTFFNHRWQFTPQSIMGSYILDFYCDELKLAIEVDGAHHKTQPGSRPSGNSARGRSPGARLGAWHGGEKRRL